MAHVELVLEKAEFFEHRVRGPGNDVIIRLQFFNILRPQRLAFTGATACGDLCGDTTTVAWRCEILTWASRGLAHTPDKMLGLLLRLGLIVRHIATQQIAKIILGDGLMRFGSSSA